MKLPPGLDLPGSDEYLLTSAEFEQLRGYIQHLAADRDHARGWAAFHKGDADRERHRLKLLVTFGRTHPDRAAQIIGTPLPMPTELVGVATDGWIGPEAMAYTFAPVKATE